MFKPLIGESDCQVAIAILETIALTFLDQAEFKAQGIESMSNLKQRPMVFLCNLEANQANLDTAHRTPSVCTRTSH